MSAVGWILLVLLAPPTRSATDAQIPSAVVREADDAVLACQRAAAEDPPSCQGVVWWRDESSDPVTISERRNVTASCELLIKDVTAQDAGVYRCTTAPPRNRTHVLLSVVSMVECKSHRFVTLECSVSGGIPRRVEWQGFEGEEGVVTTSSQRFASASFSTAHPVHAARTYELWRCHVTDNVTAREHVFIYNPKYPVKPPPPPSEAERPLDRLMVALRVAELLLLVFITVLLFIRAREKKRSAEQKVVDTSARFTSQAANQVCVIGDRQEVPVNYENVPCTQETL